MNAYRINPYTMQHQPLAWIRVNDGGTYSLVVPLTIVLGKCPRPGKWCIKGARLEGDGDLAVQLGSEWNGPNVMDDAVCRMLASLVHDILCSTGMLGAYSYLDRQRIYRDILIAQGEARWSAALQYAGLVLGNWTTTIGR